MGKQHTVLVVRANYKKAYPISHSLKKQGFQVIACIDKDSNIFRTEAITKNVDKILRISNPEKDETTYIKEIIHYIKLYNIKIIIPVGYIDFKICSKYKEILSKHCIVPVEEYSKFQYVSDKFALQKLAKELNIKYPRTLLLDDDKKNLDEFIRAVGMPLVVKGTSDGSKPEFISNQKHAKEKLGSMKEDFSNY